MGKGIGLHHNHHIENPPKVETPHTDRRHENNGHRTDRHEPRDTGRENGSVRFNHEWLHVQADTLRHNLTTSLHAGLENHDKLHWKDVILILIEHPDLTKFRGMSEQFWQQVLQISQNTGDGSRYDQLLAQMWASGMSASEFAQTLPPNERMAFLARFQIDQTFGGNFFAKDGLMLTEQGQVRLMQFLTGSNVPVSEPRVAPQPQPQPAVSERIAESFLTKVLNNAPTENTFVRRDGIAYSGTALINGGSISANDQRNFDNYQIHIPLTLASFLTEIRESFSAGATGAMFGAVVGDVVPNSGSDAGGVLGLVSGVMAGIDAEQALQSLGTGGLTFQSV